jgi:hypothetical protein
MAEEGKPRRASGSSRKPASKATGARKPAAKKPASASKSAAAKKPATTRKTSAAKKPATTRKPAGSTKKPAAKSAKASGSSRAKTTASAKAKSPRSSASAKKPTAKEATSRQQGNGAEPAAGVAKDGGKEMPPASETPAPSIGPHTEIEHEDPEERLARHEQSDTDAMGLDKRRAVVGGSYSPSVARQATLYGIFVAVIIALGVGFKLLADKLDEPPANNADKAPWSQSDAPQIPPKQPE